MGAFHRVIGIDLGTTYSAIAAYNFEKQDVRIITNRQNEPTTPSVVYMSPKGEVSVGRPAKEKLEKDPAGVLLEVKRIMGETRGDRRVAAVAHGKEVEPEVVSAYILKELKTCAELRIGEPIHDAVITVPAYFKESQKNATREAAKIARLNPRQIINEPTAAAVAYGLDSGEPRSFIVYDLGGGTFDVSVVRVDGPDSLTVLGTGGDAHLGGGDIDDLLVKWVLEQMRKEFGRDFSGDKKLYGRLRLKAERFKIDLCNQRTPQEFNLNYVTAEIPEINYTMAPDEFGRLARSLLERTLREVDVALASAAKNHDQTMDDIDSIILVGGSSKIPIVADILRERYRKALKSDLNPDEIVALGAAMVARNFEPSLAAEIHDDKPLAIDLKSASPGGLVDTHIKDVVSHTLGIGLKDDLYDPLIPKDHVIPHRVAREGYTTAEDNQTSIYVPVYQGENPKASLNFKLGEVVITGLTPEPKGAHRFEITFALDADGIFEGQIRHMTTGSVTPIKLDRGNEGITEKRRIELAQIVSSGSFGDTPRAPSRVADPIDTLLDHAASLLPSLAPPQQRELAEVCNRLRRARAEKNPRDEGTLVAQLTILLARSRS